MKKITIILIPVLLLMASLAHGQNNDSINNRPWKHYSLAVGAGWSHYINSLETVDSKDVGKDFIGISLRFLWEPEYRLSLGLETGYYRIYSVKKQVSPEISGESQFYAMPLLLVARMRIVDQFYLSVAPGLTILSQKISGMGEKISSSTLSLANFEGTATYIYPLNRRFSLGGDLKFLYFGKTNDYLYSLQVVGILHL
jgi:hypothetical protein